MTISLSPSPSRKLFGAEENVIGAGDLDPELRAKIGSMTDEIVAQVEKVAQSAQGVDVEQIQDEVERELMRHEFFSVARRYILYREEQARQRERQAGEEMVPVATPAPTMRVNRDGEWEDLDLARLEQQLADACRGLDSCCADELMVDVKRQFYNGIRPDEIGRALVLAARAKI